MDNRILWLVCYDVATDTREGRGRLRRVAKCCESMGQRVQKSVFECRLNLAQQVTFERQLLDLIDISEDCLRIYRIASGTQVSVKEYGTFQATDFEGPLVL